MTLLGRSLKDRVRFFILRMVKKILKISSKISSHILLHRTVKTKKYQNCWGDVDRLTLY